MMHTLLERRTIVWMAGAVCLCMLSMLAETTRPYPYLKEVLQNPEKFNGKPIPLLVECRIAEVTADGFVLRQMDDLIRAISARGDFQKGDDVVVEGIFRAPATLEVTHIRVAARRSTKIVISVAPIFVVFFLLMKNIAFDRKAGKFFLRAFPHA